MRAHFSQHYVIKDSTSRGFSTELCNDNALAERIVAMVKSDLSDVDADEVADEVFRSINSIQVED